MDWDKIKKAVFMAEPEPLVLRESLRARVTVAPISMAATFLSIFLFIPFMLSLGVTSTSILAWALPIIILMLLRGRFSTSTKQRVDTLTYDEMVRADWVLRISSVCNQIAVGAGIWIVQSPTVDSYVLPLFMTLISIIWCIGVLGNLFSDFPGFVLSMPFLIVQPAAYWLLRGDIGYSISVGMLLAMFLMVLLVRRGTRIFRQSILMRFEKDHLLKQVEKEQERTRAALDEARAANESKAYFMAAAGHDIKQPLYALGMLTDTLLMSNPSETATTILQTQRESIAQMRDHFDALMDLGRLESAGFRATMSDVSLREFAKRIDQEVAPQCALKGLGWEIDVVDMQVRTDEELLLRLLRNLLSNAVRYTSSGHVRCTARVEDESVCFEVADTGEGIADADQAQVFGEFVRLDRPQSDAAGVGLGLSIVAKINETLGLNLQMESGQGEGTRFRFSVPIACEGDQAQSSV